jgi:N-acetylglucosamine-6-sulfatase
MKANSLLLIASSGILTGCNLNSKPQLSEKPNIIFILADDHRYDALGFAGHPFLETPNMDKMAGEGVYFERAVVTTSLCSPSRASILTGLYAHNHGVINNYNPVDAALTFFPEYLQKEGYTTALIGKWHMGGEFDDPQRGFDYWLSFKGQGSYWADGTGTSREVPQESPDGFNINGKRVPQEGYITDELTDYAIDYLNDRKADEPFFLYVSHKAVHADFVAADRHLGRYKDEKLILENHDYKDKPMWLINQRNSRHGVDFGYYIPDFDLNTYYQRYCETLLAVDENLGRILKWVEENEQFQNTIVIYMGDNGFHFGERGIIDKRTAYEVSIRVPLLLWWPGKVKKGLVIEELVANIDIAPSLLDIAGIKVPDHMDGESFKPLIEEKEINWREEILYEYYWERNYPYTPTMHALIGDRYKFIRYQGIWDMDELYDLQNDPDETHNLINDEAYQAMTDEYRSKLFDLLDKTNGHSMPLFRDRGNYYKLRNPAKSSAADFPDSYFYELKKN